MKLLQRYAGILFLFFCIITAVAAEETAGTKRILFVDSHTSSDLWNSELKDTLQGYLKDKEVLGVYETYELGIRFRQSALPTETDISTLNEKMAQLRYDLIVISDNDAVELFLNGVLKAPKNIPLLVTSYYGSLAGRIPGKLNMTGIETQMDLAENIRYGLQLLPAEQIALISGDSASGRNLKKIIETTLPKEIASKLIFLNGSTHTTAELLEQVAGMPKNSLILFHSWSSTKEDLPENSYTLLPRLQNVFKGLLFGKYDSYIRFGASGGLMICSKDQGVLAGKMAYRLLNGESAAAVPIQKGEARFLLDYLSIMKKGISPTRIPQEATLLNVPPDFVTRYRGELLFGCSILVMLLLLYIIALRYRRLSLRKVQIMFANLPLQAGVVDEYGQILYLHIMDDPEKAKLSSIRKLKELPAPIRELFADTVRQTFETHRRMEIDYELNARKRHADFIPLPDDNPFQTRAVMWASQDVTELSNAHLAAREVADRFRMTLESIGDGVIVTDREGTVTLLNPIAAKLTGYSSKEAIGKKLDEIFNIVSYLTGNRVESPLRKALETNSVVELANHTDLISKDGTRRHIADCASPIHDKENNISGGVLVFRDVTEDYEKRDKLRLNSVVLKNAADIAQFIYFRYDGKETTFVSKCNSGFWPQRGGRPAPIEEWIAPEDVQSFKDGWGKLVGGELSVWSQTYAAGPKENRRYFEIRMEESINEINSRREFCGIIQDITHSRQNEIRYRDNLKLLETIINNLPGYIFVKDISDQFRYLLCNSTFEKLVGVPKEKIIHHVDADIFLKDPKAGEKFEADNRMLVRTGKTQDMQELFVNAHGKRSIVRTIKNIVTLSDGQQLLLGMGIDISRQYQLEQEQKKTIETLNNYIGSERIINQSLTRMTLETDFHKAVNEMLRIIGENAGADRSYIFRYTADDLTRSDNEYEWVREGITPQFDNLQNVDMTELPQWAVMLSARKDIVIPDITHPPDGLELEAKFLSRQDIRSLLVSGIWVDGRLYGYVGLDFVRNTVNFTESDIHTVHSIVNLFLLARERQLQLDRIADTVSLQRQIVDNISIPITILDLDYNIVTLNPKASKDTGQTQSELVGKKCYEHQCHSKGPPDFCPVKDTLLDQKIHSKENTAGNRHQISTAQPIFDRDGKMIYVLVSDIDITELTRQKQELQKAMEQAQAADRAKSYFLATVSHELRTPLNAVIGFSELLQQGVDDETVSKEYLNSINCAGNALLNLINDVLDLSKLEADQLTFVAAETDIAALMDEIASVFKLRVQQKNLQLHTECLIRRPLCVDHLRLRQIILNLVGNAVKFTDSGSVSLFADFKLEAQDEGTLIMKVSDTGIGIQPENAKKIFEPFVQEGSIRGQHVYEGTGLGLAITQRLISRMDGEIKLESSPGKGSVFTVLLHHVKAVPVSEKENAVESTESIPAGPEEKGRRVLLVDDVPMNLKVLRAMLKKINIEGVCAESAKAALDILRKDRRFDIIMTDLWMPEINGAEFAGILAKDPAVARIPVIAVTADSQVSAETAALFAGVLLKPITVQSLEEIIDKLSANKRPAS